MSLAMSAKCTVRARKPENKRKLILKFYVQFLAIRSQRREIDHVLDKPNDELIQEEKLVAEAKRILAVVRASVNFCQTFV